uniref:Uncharacterized protein n=1 Tax=Terrapene triunguis TaxID=2587831 RepID=A0A674J204_9SAUR
QEPSGSWWQRETQPRLQGLALRISAWRVGGQRRGWPLPALPRTNRTELGDKYGPVFTIYLGAKRAVVLWGYEAVKEALVDQAEEFGGREGLALVDRTSKGNGEEQSGSRRHGSSGRESASWDADGKPQTHPAPDQRVGTSLNKS